MKKNFLPFLLAFLPFCLFSQVSGNYNNNDYQQQQQSRSNYMNMPKQSSENFKGNRISVNSDNTIVLEVNALQNQKAMAYVAVFNLTQLGKDIPETEKLFTERLDAFVNALKAIPISSQDIYVDMVSFKPKFEFDVTKKLFSKKSYNEIPSGFELQKNVHIRLSNPAQLDKMVSVAAGLGIYDLVKVDYFVENQQAIYKDLRDKSFDYLKDMVVSYKKIGLQLDTTFMLTAERTDAAFPIDRYKSFQVYAASSIQQKLDKNANVDLAEKPVATFYDAISPRDFDIVVNPVILEPAVQFTYKLTARFKLNEKITPIPKKEVYLLTPNGDLKAIKLD